MGIKYNNNKISQSSKDSQYPYYNGTKLSQVYYNGNLVWKKYTALDFTFNGNSVTGYTGSATSFTIPSSYSVVYDIDNTPIFISGADITVTDIAANAFKENSTVTSVTIPSSIRTIGEKAFFCCINLSTISMSATPQSIGAQAFAITNLSGLSSYMINCPTLGAGCFAFRNAWYISTSDATLHNKFKDYAHSNEKIEGTGDFASYKGCHNVGSFWWYFRAYWNGGTQSPAMSVGNIIGRAGLCNSSGTHTHTITQNSGSLGQNVSRTFERVFIGGYYSTVNVEIGYEKLSYNAHAEKVGRTWQTGDRDSSGRCKCLAEVYIVSDCILQGAKILLANGSYKNIEDLQYTDLLKVWNFELGKYDYQYPLAIIIKGKVQGYRRIHLEDGSHIDITDQHEFFDPVHHTIRVYGSGGIYEIKPEDDYYVMKYVNNYTYDSIKVISIEDMSSEEPIQSYSLVTGGTISYFVDNVLSCMKTIEYVGLTEENKFGKHFAKDKETCYTYDRFEKEIYADSSKYIILGNNLQYVDYYNKDTSGFDGLLAPFKHMLPLPVKDGKVICNIGFLEDTSIKEEHHLEDELITLPEFKSNKYTKWYVVGEYREYKPGDTITVNFSTLIRAI